MFPGNARSQPCPRALPALLPALLPLRWEPPGRPGRRANPDLPIGSRGGFPRWTPKLSIYIIYRLIFHYKPSSYWGTIILGNHHVLFLCFGSCLGSGFLECQTSVLSFWSLGLLSRADLTMGAFIVLFYL